jgi:DNA-binding MarR family transcriptional regulator
MTLDQAVGIIQTAYPQVYLACHTRHQRKRSTEHRLSSRDSSILAHLDETTPLRPAQLAAHLGIARSTTSEALKKLLALGFVRRDGGAAVLLSERGRQAIGDTSVLETERLREVMRPLTPADREVIVRGLSMLAAACRARGERTASSRGGVR